MRRRVIPKSYNLFYTKQSAGRAVCNMRLCNSRDDFAPGVVVTSQRKISNRCKIILHLHILVAGLSVVYMFIFVLETFCVIVVKC